LPPFAIAKASAFLPFLQRTKRQMMIPITAAAKIEKKEIAATAPVERGQLSWTLKQKRKKSKSTKQNENQKK
jgi:hypothetical protein